MGTRTQKRKKTTDSSNPANANVGMSKLSSQPIWIAVIVLSAVGVLGLGAAIAAIVWLHNKNVKTSPSSITTDSGAESGIEMTERSANNVPEEGEGEGYNA